MSNMDSIEIFDVGHDVGHISGYSMRYRAWTPNVVSVKDFASFVSGLRPKMGLRKVAGKVRNVFQNSTNFETG